MSNNNTVKTKMKPSTWLECDSCNAKNVDRPAVFKQKLELKKLMKKFIHYSFPFIYSISRKKTNIID